MPASTRTRVSVTAAVAAAVAVVLAVDPFGLGGVSAQFARAATTTEDRAGNFANAIANLPVETAAATAPATGSWPAGATTTLPLQAANLPTPAEATVTVPGSSAASVNLGGMSVEVAQAADTTAPDSVKLTVGDAAAADAVGVTGVVMHVTDASTGGTSGNPVVDLTVSYAGFAGLVGGDWSSRLHLVRVPDCATTTPDAAACQPQPISSVNDPAAQTVSGVVPVDPAPLTGGFGQGRLAALDTGTGGSIAVTAGVSGSAGDWSKTGLSPSSTWGTSGNTGAFTWSYPLHVPAPSAGPAPQLGLSYSSAVSDGRVPTANNQSGWIGEGFDLTSSFIERTYKPCRDDAGGAANNAGRDAGDLCWGPGNATLVFKGAATPLIKDGSVWRAKSDDGTRMELATGGWNAGSGGEYWKVTTTDGTQYFFGRGKLSSGSSDLNSAWTVPVYGNHPGDPCYKADGDGGFAASRCAQVWRWNLDHVVDPSGNTMTYTYATESNAYVPDYTANTAWTPTSYVAGGHLTKIEYGTREGVTGPAPYRVSFGTEARCVTDRNDGTKMCSGGSAETDKSKWVDTPTDLQCDVASTTCKNVSPVFFDTTRLAKITTQAWDGAAYQDVDTWALTQQFVGDGDGNNVQFAQNVTLRLNSVKHTGNGGTTTTSDDVSLPPVQFTYQAMPNRVDSPTDGQSALWRPRLIQVRTDSGGAVNVGYQNAECDAAHLPGSSDAEQAANTKLCFLQKWQPAGERTPRNFWFHKYVVASIVEDGAPHTTVGSGDLITGSVSKVTRYRYLGGAAWVKPVGPLVDPAQATYSEFRGFAQVDTAVGEGAEQATVSHTTYFRGTGATLTAGPTGYTATATDRDGYAGQVFDTQTLNGSTPLAETITQPGVPVTVVAGSGGLSSTRIPSTTSLGFAYDASGALTHRTSTTSSRDDAGQTVTVDARGDLADATDDVCTKTAYRRDGVFTTANQLAYPSSVETYAGACDGTLTATTLIARATTTYDDAGHVLQATSVDPGNPSADVVRSTATYDDRGRVLTITDAAGNTTTTGYTAGAGGQVQKVTSTSPDPDGAGPLAAFTTTESFNPLTGLPTSSTDQNGLVTTSTYDALGRPTSLRLPQNKDTAKPSVEYSYLVSDNGLNAVQTRTLGADGNRQHTTVVLYDGMLRPFQQQVEGAAAQNTDRGRMVTHITYDSAGRISEKSSPWFAAGAPGMQAIAANPSPPSQTTYAYDKAGRVTDQILWAGTPSNPANEKWRTTTGYDGDTTTTTPPQGGTRTQSVTDAHGRIIRLVEYGPDPAGGTGTKPQTTRYVYDTAGRLTTMTDPAGNTWSYTYDLAGQQISASDPDTGTTTTTYDTLGHVATRTNANGATLAYTYDPLGRQTTLRDGSTTGTVRASWTYDQSTLPGGAAALGQVSSAVRTVNGKQYTTAYPAYDTAYRPTSVTTTLPTDAALNGLSGASFSTGFGYTADGQLATTTYPQVNNGSTIVLGKETVTTRYDAASMPSWMSGGFGWGTYVADSRWTADGKPLAQDLGNTYGAVVSYGWDAATGRLNGISLDRERVNGTELQTSYGYDPAGNVTSMVDAPTDASVAGQRDAQCFQYDQLQQLRTAWTAATGLCATTPLSTADVGGIAPYWTQYAYDVLGNRTQMTEHTGTTVTTTDYQHGAGTAGPHALTSLTKTPAGGAAVTTGFTWDTAGNQLTRTTGTATQTQTWDPEGELAGVSGAATQSNVYDADGSRLIRTDSSGVTVYLPGGQEVRATSTTVSATRWYAFGGHTVAVRTGVGMGGVSSIVTDAHGTPIASVKNTDWAAAITRIRTDPFGAPRTGQTGTAAGHGFLGAPADPTALTLLGARYYDPATGTFISPDPLMITGQPAQFNAYQYAANNPMTNSDPSGKCYEAGFGDALSMKSHCSKEGGAQGVSAPSPSTVVTADRKTQDYTERAVGWAQQAVNGRELGVLTKAEKKARVDQAHVVLSTCGMAPVAGIPCNAADAAICVGEGDWGCVGLDLAAFLPIGALAKLGKLGKLAGKLEGSSQDFVNLASKSRTAHILAGDATGGGHMWPGSPGKSVFPKGWSGERIMHEISDVATDPSLEWSEITGRVGAEFTRGGAPVRYAVTGIRDGVKIKVIVEPGGAGIITGFPIP